MPDLDNVLADLLAQRAALDNAILAIEKLQQHHRLGPKRRGRPKGSRNKSKRPRTNGAPGIHFSAN